MEIPLREAVMGALSDTLKPSARFLEVYETVHRTDEKLLHGQWKPCGSGHGLVEKGDLIRRVIEGPARNYPEGGYVEKCHNCQGAFTGRRDDPLCRACRVDLECLMANTPEELRQAMHDAALLQIRTYLYGRDTPAIPEPG